MRILMALWFLSYFGWNWANAADVVLTWDAPTTNVDGSPLTDLAGFEIYQRTVDGAYDYTTPIANLPASGTTMTVSNLSEGHYVWIVLAVDGAGNKSYASNEAGAQIIIPPGEPQNLQVQ